MVECKEFGFKDADKEERARGVDPDYYAVLSNFPKPEKRFRLVYQCFNQSIEETYFWLLASLREDWGLHNVKKITDVFTASEQSAFWGQAQQRMTISQGQVSNYLATIGKLVKELFQLVRELRIHEERMNLYDESIKAESKGTVFDRKMSQSAEVVLRSYWIDLKDGGVKSPGSVYGLASTLGYTALPDLFFAAPPMKKDEVDSYVDRLAFNDKLKNVLRRKLQAYCVWKETTYKELKNRYGFLIKFLRQHYNAIQMYIEWVKPYLRNVKRLSQNFEKTESEDLIGAFEGSFTEIEIVLSRKITKREKDNVQAVVVLNILFRTQPHMEFHQEGYQHKGPVHVGRSEIVLRGYSWTDDEINNYFRMREQETMDVLGDIDKSLKEAIDALGDDLRRFLKEAGEKFPEDAKKEEDVKKAEEKRKAEMKGVLEPFTAIFYGFKDIFVSFFPSRGKKKDKDKPSSWQVDKDKDEARKVMGAAIWNTYKNFKKAHKMVTW
jgi:hypothetical protein